MLARAPEDLIAEGASARVGRLDRAFESRESTTPGRAERAAATRCSGSDHRVCLQGSERAR